LSSESIKNDSFEDISVLYATTAACKRQLEALREKLKIPKTGVQKLTERFIWFNAKREDVEKALLALHRCSRTFQFSLTIEGCRVLSRLSNEVTDILLAQK
jgi:hypothetical protein